MKILTREAKGRLRSLKGSAIALVAGAIGAASLGTLVGWLTGQSGPDPTVTAATIPAVLSLVGVVLIFKGVADAKPLQSIGIALVILVFCISLYFAVLDSVKSRNSGVYTNAQEADELHLRHLEACSKAQYFFNMARRAKQLAPLGPEYFCRKVSRSSIVHALP